MEGTDGVLDLGRIARTITAADPDLVALQEEDQAVELARLTSMHVAFGANFEFQGGLYGNAVMSRLPVTRHRNHPLPNPTDGER